MTNSVGYDSMREGDQQCRVRGRVTNSVGYEGG